MTKFKSGMVTRGIAYLATDTLNNGNGIFLTNSERVSIDLNIYPSQTSLQIQIRRHVKSKIRIKVGIVL